MKMQVIDAVSGIATHVEHEPVSTIGERIDTGNFLSRNEQIGDVHTLLGRHFRGIGNMHLRNDQHVRGRGWIQVSESEAVRAFRNLGRGDFPSDDPTEDAAHRAPNDTGLRSVPEPTVL